VRSKTPRTTRTPSQCLAALAVVVLTGCGNKYAGFENPSSPTPVTLANGSMGATIAGTPWNADQSVQAVSHDPSIEVSGSDSHAWVVVLSAAKMLGIQTNATCTVLNSSGQWNTFAGGSAQVSVTALTANRITGTFSCTQLGAADSNAKGTKSITSGTFDIAF